LFDNVALDYSRSSSDCFFWPLF